MKCRRGLCGRMWMALGVLLLSACSGVTPEGEDASPVLSQGETTTQALGTPARGLHSLNKVLILASTVSRGTDSVEAQVARQLGYEVTLASDDEWRSLSTADFASYRALILGDKSCSVAPGLLLAAEETRHIWGPVVDGNVIVVGTDPVYHKETQVTFNAVQFAAAEPGKTGMYAGLSCYYYEMDSPTPVPVLSPFGSFQVSGTSANCKKESSYNDAHIVASHEALEGLTDAVLSNWACSVHEVFHSYPEGDFTPLVIALDPPSGGRWPGSRDFPDGSHGVPYVLARGAAPVRCGDGLVQYPEQCDTGSQNGVPGTPCSAVCRTQWCGDGVVDPGEECDTGASNGSGSCSASCRALALPPVARCKDLLLSTTTTCGATGSVDDGSSDPDGDLVGCTQTPSATFALGTTGVTLTCTDATGLSASCTARVTVTDTTPPSIDCSPALAVECTGRHTSVEVPAPVVSDVCEFGYQRTTEATAFPVGGPYAVGYEAFDSSGNTSACATQVRVLDTAAPTVTLVGEAAQTLACGTPYVEAGVQAADLCDNGEASSPVVTVSGSVNTQVPGTYVVTYSAQDSSGNVGRATRRVTVTPSSACEAPQSGWTLTGSMVQPRLSHTATLLEDGRVLVTGGFNVSSELYGPSTRTFSVTGSNLGSHRGHTATRLRDGRVLIAGGTSSTTRPSAELYVPASGTWQATGRLITSRFNHAAVLLPSGKVLVAGGFDKESGGSPLRSAELYDPATGVWSSTSALAYPRGFHTMTLLPDGKVLVTGGSLQSDHELESATLVPEAELYDPVTETWTSAGRTRTGHAWHTATRLPDGKVLVVGGVSLTVPLGDAAELYDPATGTWKTTGSMKSPRRWHTATLLPNGEVMVAGGYHQYTGIQYAAERYNPATDTWSATVAMHVDRYQHTATLLPDGTVLAVGGASNHDQASAEYYRP
ncbi:kelch repeat-containing protein [Cystobacter fuscus]|nr:kelch repeat-containing protein [Cystobacter fuscus]